jgi:dTDP-4-amino-4,6-dideoxygalactose transaminase
MKKKIIFNIPKIVGNEFQNLKKLSNFKQFSGNGYFTKKCSSWLIKNIMCKDALLVHSCTAALEMCAILLNIKPGDEIIMPSYTFVSTANAFVLRGAKIKFIDIDHKTLNIDENLIQKSITKKTKAIVVVHYAGVSCEMNKISKIAKKYKIILIEDAAQAFLSKYKNKHLGSFGDLATISFHETKNIHCGEGGALLINNKKFIKKAKIIRDKGTNRDDFNKNLVKKYSWVSIGSSYVLSEINASFLYEQLTNAKKITSERVKLWKIYHKYFENLELQGSITRPFVPKYSGNNGHSYWVTTNRNIRNKVLKYLNSKNIMALFHYIPLHSSPFAKKILKNNDNLKITNLKSESIIRMPMHLDIKKKDIMLITNLLTKFFKKPKQKVLN